MIACREDDTTTSFGCTAPITEVSEVVKSAALSLNEASPDEDTSVHSSMASDEINVTVSSVFAVLSLAFRMRSVLSDLEKDTEIRTENARKAALLARNEAVHEERVRHFDIQ